jgi:type I restriction enzyme S subunit
MSKKRLVPKRRFKGFTDDWEQRKAKDVCSIGTGKSDTQDQVADGAYPFYIRSDIPVRSDKYLYDCEAVITIGDGNIGKVFHYVNGKFDLHQRCYKMADFRDIWGHYFYYFFSTKFYDRAMRMTAKATVDSVRLEMISEMDILKPTQLAEQTIIAEFFSHLDHLITLHQRKLEKAKSLKKSLLSEMFPAEGERKPKRRFPGFTGDWEQRKLGEVADIVGGGTPSTNISEYWDGNIDWYSPAEIADQIYVNSSLRKITERGFASCSAKLLPIGTVLFTSRAGIGKTAILSKGGCTNQGFQSIVPHTDKLDSYFIYSRTEELKRYGETFGAGSTFVEVSGKQMSDMPLMLPKMIEEQKMIGTYFEYLDHLITLHQRKLEKLQNLKKAYLNEMFI